MAAGRPPARPAPRRRQQEQRLQLRAPLPGGDAGSGLRALGGATGWLLGTQPPLRASWRRPPRRRSAAAPAPWKGPAHMMRRRRAGPAAKRGRPGGELRLQRPLPSRRPPDRLGGHGRAWPLGRPEAAPPQGLGAPGPSSGASPGAPAPPRLPVRGRGRRAACRPHGGGLPAGAGAGPCFTEQCHFPTSRSPPNWPLFFINPLDSTGFLFSKKRVGFRHL